MKNILVVLLGAILWVLPAQAVLKERDLGKTLSILRSELTNSHNEQSKQLSKFKEQRDRVRNKLFSILSNSNQNALMLYSQKPDYVFDLTYACHEATEQFRDFKKSALPFRSFVDRQNAEIARYDSLIVALKHMPTVNMTEQEKIDRNVCLTFAINIRRSIEDQKTALNEYMRYYDLTENRLKTLNDYANKRYSEIQNNIFINGGESYFSATSIVTPD